MSDEACLCAIAEPVAGFVRRRRTFIASRDLSNTGVIEAFQFVFFGPPVVVRVRPQNQLSTDPLTFGTVLVVLAATALVAAWIPARRAAHVDPVKALRAE